MCRDKACFVSANGVRAPPFFNRVQDPVPPHVFVSKKFISGRGIFELSYKVHHAPNSPRPCFLKIMNRRLNNPNHNRCLRKPATRRRLNFSQVSYLRHSPTCGSRTRGNSKGDCLPQSFSSYCTLHGVSWF